MSLVGLPSLSLDADLVPFAVVAVSMIAITIFLFWKVLPARGQPPLVTQMTLALAVLGGGSVLLLALLFVFLNSDGTSAWTWVLLAFNFMMMAPAGLWFIGLVVFRDRRVAPTDWTWPASLAVVAAGSEAMMGVLFVVGDNSSTISPVPVLALGLTSVWFFWSMAAVMAPLVVWAPLARVERGGLVALTIAAVLAPWITAYPIVGGVASAVLMSAVFAALLRELATRRRVTAAEVPFLGGLAAAFLAMAVTGFAVVATGGSDAALLAFGAVMGLVMTVEIAYLVRRFYHGPWQRPWVARAPDSDERAELAAGSRTTDETPGRPEPGPGTATRPSARPGP